MLHGLKLFLLAFIMKSLLQHGNEDFEAK